MKVTKAFLGTWALLFALVQNGLQALLGGDDFRLIVGGQVMLLKEIVRDVKEASLRIEEEAVVPRQAVIAELGENPFARLAGLAEQLRGEAAAVESDAGG